MTITDVREITPTGGEDFSAPAAADAEYPPSHDPETGESASTDGATADDDGKKNVHTKDDEGTGFDADAAASASLGEPGMGPWRRGNLPIRPSRSQRWRSAPTSFRRKSSSRRRRVRRSQRRISELCEATELDLDDDWDDDDLDDQEAGQNGQRSPRHHQADVPVPIIIEDNGVGVGNDEEEAGAGKTNSIGKDDNDAAAAKAAAASERKRACADMIQNLEYESMGMLDARHICSDDNICHGTDGDGGDGDGKNNMDGTTRDNYDDNDGHGQHIRKSRPGLSAATRTKSILMEPSTPSSTMMYGGRTSSMMSAAGMNSIATTIRRRMNSIDAMYSTDPFEISYHPDKFRFYQPPLQRQRWGQTQVLPRINWGDLFFDLFYVGAAYKTSNILVDTPSAIGVLYFLGTFFSIMQMWMNKTFFDARFVNSGDDLYHRMWEVAHLTALASAILHIQSVPIMSHPTDYQDMFAFAVSSAVVQFLCILRLVELYYVGRGQRDVLQQVAIREGVNLCVGLTLQVVAAVLAGMDYFGPNGAGGGGGSSGSGSDSGGHRWLASTTAAGTEYYSNATTDATTTYSDAAVYDASVINTVPIWLCLMVPIFYWLAFAVHSIIFWPRDGYSHKKFMVPLNVSFSIHRDGEWTMLMYGESILSLLTIDIPQETSEYYLTFYFSLSTVILLQYLHFRSQPHDPDDHVFRRSKDRSLIWKFFLFSYAASLIALGSAFTLFVNSFSYPSSSSEGEASDGHQTTTTTTRHLSGSSAELLYPGDEMVQRAAYLFSASLALVYLSMDVMSLMHVGLKHSQRRIYCKKSRIFNRVGIILISFRIALLSFCATLGVWCSTNVEALSGIGLAATIVQLALRRLGETFLPEEVEFLDGTEVAMG